MVVAAAGAEGAATGQVKEKSINRQRAQDADEAAAAGAAAAVATEL